MKAQRQSLDRISALPQDTIEKILTLMPIRDALRTSILSRRWRYSWRTIPKLAFDNSLIVRSDDDEVDEYRFVKAMFHVFLLHRAPILEFSLSVSREISEEIDQIILHLSSSNDIKKIVFSMMLTYSYELPCSFFSLQGLEHIDLECCMFEPPLRHKGFGMLKTLRFYDCQIPSFESLFDSLPIAPYLRNLLGLEIIWTRCLLKVSCLSCLSVYLQFRFLKSQSCVSSFCFWLKHLAAGSIPHISLPHLRILDLVVCYLELSLVLCVIRSSPNLEMMNIRMCSNHDWCCREQTLEKLHDLEDYRGLNLDHFKELEITNVTESDSWMEFVKLVMGRSPMLKRATIELGLYCSVNKEVDMLRDLPRMPFSRASPTANFIIKRHRNCRVEV